MKFSYLAKKSMKKHRITILGAGMVGKAIAYDLSQQHHVTIADIDPEALEFCKENYQVETIQTDLKKLKQQPDIFRESDLVVSAVPGFMGFETIKVLIEQGKNVVDISFMPEDFLELDSLAKKHNVTAIVDCGVAPGMPNLILGYHSTRMKIEKFDYMVGGLPFERKFPFEYKAPFSPIDVLEEYTRPARIMEHGMVQSKPAMSDLELVYFEGLGHLEAFNTDGLRSLLYTMKNIPHMKEKTLRYPGHIRLIEALKASGFFSTNTVQIGDQSIQPLEVTNKLLIDEWKLQPEEPEFTIMRIQLKGPEKSVTYDLFDQYDETTNLSSMSRTTGFTACAAANLILEKRFNRRGVFPPEIIGKEEKSFRYIMNYLDQRNVSYVKS